MKLSVILALKTVFREDNYTARITLNFIQLYDSFACAIALATINYYTYIQGLRILINSSKQFLNAVAKILSVHTHTPNFYLVHFVVFTDAILIFTLS